MNRENFKSRLGFILISAGCAIGIGNVWKFPYMAGMNGGGAFVCVYLFFLVVLGVPVLTMEFAMGRASRKSPVKMFQEIEPKGSKWHIYGYFALAGNYLLMMFYTVVAGWMLQYFVKMAKGDFAGADTAKVSAEFAGMLENPGTLTLYMLITVIVGFAICALGVQKGVEKITKWMMSALIVIMVILAVNSIFQKGGSEGLKFYLLPDISQMKEVGIGNVIVAAMNQAFFTLSLGIGSMAVFGSYIGKERALMGEAVNVALLDTFVALTSGLIIFPACFAYDVPVTSGPNLIFITLPNVFNNIPGGRIWGSLFFIFMSFAALSTVIGVFENIIACSCDMFHVSRKKASLINGVLMFFLSMPCVLGYNIWKEFQPLGAGTTVLDLEDFVVSNLLLPIGSLVFVLFCVSRYGWGWDKFVAEANTGKGWKVARWMRGYMTFVLPFIVLAIFVVGII